MTKDKVQVAPFTVEVDDTEIRLYRGTELVCVYDFEDLMYQPIDLIESIIWWVQQSWTAAVEGRALPQADVDSQKQ